MRLKRKTIKELQIILKEEFELELNYSETEKVAYNLVGLMTLLTKLDSRRKFGNSTVRGIEKSSKLTLHGDE